MAAATLYRERFGDTPGIVYAAGVDHAYNLATAFRAAGVKAEAVSGRTPPVKLAEILAAYERGEIDVLINAMLLAEGWNSPRATVVMHLAPTASKRVYQQRIGRIMRIHPRKEAGIVVDFTPKAATHNERVVSLHSLLDADFYREGARVTPAPRRRTQRRARRKLTPASWLVPVTPDVLRRQDGDRARVAARRPEVPRRGRAGVLGRDRRPPAALRRARGVRREADRARRVEARDGDVPLDLRGAEPEPAAAADRARRPRLDEGRARRLRRPRHARRRRRRRGRRIAPPASASCCARSPTGSPTRRIRSSRAGRGGSRAPCASSSTARRRRSTRTRSGCSARSRTRAATGTRRTPRSSSTPRSRCRSEVGAALLASAEGYTPRATQLLEAARERLGDDPGGRRLDRRQPAAAEDRPDARAQAPPPQEEGAGDAGGAAGRRPRRPRQRRPTAPSAPRRRRRSAAAAAGSPPLQRAGRRRGEARAGASPRRPRKTRAWHATNC